MPSVTARPGTEKGAAKPKVSRQFINLRDTPILSCIRMKAREVVDALG